MDYPYLGVSPSTHADHFRSVDCLVMVTFKLLRKQPSIKTCSVNIARGGGLRFGGKALNAGCTFWVSEVLT